MNQGYRDKVEQLAQLSSSTTLLWTHCKNLHEFLKNATARDNEDARSFALLYNFFDDGQRTRRYLAADFAPTEVNKSDSASQLLFLSGYPSASLLGRLGDVFELEPAFFEKHLEFIGKGTTVTDMRSNHCTLPSRQDVIFQTSVSSVGATWSDAYGAVQDKRAVVTKEMERHMDDIWTNKLQPFDSVVRSIEVHDDKRFTLEQYVTLLVREDTESNHWLIVVWSDAGAELSQNHKGSIIHKVFGSSFTHFNAINLVRSKYDLVPRLEHRLKGYCPVRQSLSLLPRDYGMTLAPKAISSDPIYALTELFAFLAISESCYMNTIASVLDECTSSDLSSPLHDNVKARATLVYSWRSLERRRLQMANIAAFLLAKQSGMSSTERSSIEKTAIAQVLHDFDFLQGFGRRLQERFNQELSFITNDAAVTDAEWNKLQSRNNHRLTVLATVYLPLSFACSVFGMQFLTISTVQLGFALWAAIALPLFVISFIFLVLDKERRHTLMAFVRAHFQKIPVVE